jgi:hypothetical protein
MRRYARRTGSERFVANETSATRASSRRLWWRVAPRLAIAAVTLVVFGYLGWRDIDDERQQRRLQQETERCLADLRASSQRTGASIDEASCFID